MEKFRKIAIIVAAGNGTRMGSKLPKQALQLVGKSILEHTLDAFLAAYDDLQIILVLSSYFLENLTAIIPNHLDDNRISIVEGGETRYHSVQKGIQKAPDDSIIFVHDGVRCLISSELIHRCYEDAMQYESSIPVVKMVDSLRIIRENGQNKILNRDNIRAVQTPQTFTSALIKRAFEQNYQDSFTDEASVVENLGIQVHLTEGETSNIKITTPIDLAIAELLLKERII